MADTESAEAIYRTPLNGKSKIEKCEAKKGPNRQKGKQRNIHLQITKKDKRKQQRQKERERENTQKRRSDEAAIDRMGKKGQDLRGREREIMDESGQG